MPDFATSTAIATYLGQFTEDPEVLKLLVASLGRVFGKTADRGEEWRGMVSSGDIIHIADWLTAARINGLPWLEKVDDKGRPVKLAKFGTVAQIIDEADKAMRRMASGMATGLSEGDEIDLMQLEDGYNVVRMLTPSALDLESVRMQHCIGQGAYDMFVDNPDFGVVFLSLRDHAGNPHATVQIDRQEVLQVQGKQNRPPLGKYLDRLSVFFESHGITKTRSSSGYVMDDKGCLLRVDELPDGAVIPGDFEIQPVPGLRLPKRLTVLGNMSITDSADITMPEQLVVGGDFKLFLARSATPIHRLDVGGRLTVGMCTITKLAENLKASELAMKGNHISRIADRASISGNVEIYGGGGRVGDEYKGLLDIDCLREVGGSLTLHNCPLERLPDQLNVGGSLIVWRGRFERFPEGMTVGGSVSVTWSWLDELPIGFRCNDDLILTSTLLTALPERLHVIGSLDIANTKIAELPSDIFVGGSLRVANSSVSRIPESMKVIDGTLDISGTTVSELPAGLFIAVDLVTSNSAMDDVPDHISVGRMVVGNVSGEARAAVSATRLAM